MLIFCINLLINYFFCRFSDSPVDVSNAKFPPPVSEIILFYCLLICRCHLVSSSKCPVSGRNSRCLKRSFHLWSWTSLTSSLRVELDMLHKWTDPVSKKRCRTVCACLCFRSSAVQVMWEPGTRRVHRMFQRSSFQPDRFQSLLQDMFSSGDVCATICSYFVTVYSINTAVLTFIMFLLSLNEFMN